MTKNAADPMTKEELLDFVMTTIREWDFTKRAEFFSDLIYNQEICVWCGFEKERRTCSCGRTD